MDVEEILGKNKWAILKELSKGSRSASEIAKKIGLSTAHVLNNLKILEANNIIKKPKHNEAAGKKKVGKPKTHYCLNQEFIVAGVLRPGLAEKSFVRLKDLDDFQKISITSFFSLESTDSYCLLKLACQTNLLKKADLIAYIKSNEHELELFVVTEELAEVREQYSNIIIESFNGKTKKVISWSHNRKEVEDGLMRNEEYFINLVKNSRELLDKRHLLEELRAK